MFPQRSQVIQGSFPAGRPRVVVPVVRPGQPGRPVVQPAGPSYVTQLDPTRLNLGGAGGSALPEPVQRKMEAFYKTDFSDVRVHVGPQASSIGALAFTLGSNIYFAPGQYNPHSMQGQQLLGHELAHVLQQRAGRVRNPQGSGVAVVQDPHLEAEADRLGRQAAAQPMMAVGGAAVQRPELVQAKPAASLPGAKPVAAHVQAAIAAEAQPKLPAPQQGGRRLAAHVQAAVAAVGQPKTTQVQPRGLPLAPHVQAAVAACAQPKLPATQPSGRPLAPHVQAAVTAGAQPKMPMAQPGGRPLAPHVQAAIAAGAQSKRPTIPPGGRSLAPHVQAAVAAVGQPKVAANLDALVADGGRGGDAAVQRKIEFKPNGKILPAHDLAEMTEQLVALYGANNRDFIVGELNKINNLNRPWTPSEVNTHFSRLRLVAYQEVQFGSSGPEPSLPGPPRSDEHPKCNRDKRAAALGQFAFTSVTQLVGVVADWRFEFRNDSDNDLHAEQCFMAAVEQNCDLRENPVIVITINNSPCQARCAGLMAAWVRKHNLTQVTVYFANPYGDDNELRRATRTLQGAGIAIHGFVPLDLAGSETDEEVEDKYRRRHVKMAERLRKAKAHGAYHSDEEDKREEEARDDRRAPARSRSRSPRRRQEKDRDRDRPELRVGGELAALGALRNVSGDGLNCLIRALLVAAGGDEDAAHGLRADLDRRGFAHHGSMLELAGAAGAILVSQIAPDRGVVVYLRTDEGRLQRHVVVEGVNPLRLYLADNHFQAFI